MRPRHWLVTGLCWVGLASTGCVSLTGTPMGAPRITHATGALQWDWSAGTGQEADRFYVRCGPQPDAYDYLQRRVDMPTRHVPLRQIAPVEGTVYCVVVAATLAADGQSVTESDVREEARIECAGKTSEKSTCQATMTERRPG